VHERIALAQLLPVRAPCSLPFTLPAAEPLAVEAFLRANGNRPLRAPAARRRKVSHLVATMLRGTAGSRIGKALYSSKRPLATNNTLSCLRSFFRYRDNAFVTAARPEPFLERGAQRRATSAGAFTHTDNRAFRSSAEAPSGSHHRRVSIQQELQDCQECWWNPGRRENAVLQNGMTEFVPRSSSSLNGAKKRGRHTCRPMGVC
jgi:hypothetical protein